LASAEVVSGGPGEGRAGKGGAALPDFLAFSSISRRVEAERSAVFASFCEGSLATLVVDRRSLKSDCRHSTTAEGSVRVTRTVQGRKLTLPADDGLLKTDFKAICKAEFSLGNSFRIQVEALLGIVYYQFANGGYGEEILQ
jgi:hypothetical protein